MNAPAPTFAGLLSSELRRALARRLVRLLVLIAVAGIVTAGVVVFVRSSRTVSTKTVSRPGLVVNGACEPFQFGPGPRAAREGDHVCEAQETTSQNHAFALVRLSDRHHLGDSFLTALAGPLIFAGLLAAASMIAAEWRSNTIAVLLTWEPRRVRVLLAKLLTVVVVSFAIAVVLQVLLGLSLTPAAVWHGSTAGLDGAWYRTAAWLITRIACLTSVAAVIGFTIGSIGRNTTAAMGAAFAYLLVGEVALRTAKPRWEGWFLSHNIGIVINGSRGIDGRHGLGTAFVILISYSVALTVIATLLFARRDVT